MTSRRDGFSNRWTGRGGVFARGVVLLALSGAPALASDGVLEINQTCAVQTGCFENDTPGYPVTITRSGSYLLTSNLVIATGDGTGILVSTNDVAIDLNEFSIVRNGCLNAASSCLAASGSGSGIERALATNRGISVRDGSVTGMGRFGSWLGEYAVVENVKTRWNREDGIVAELGSLVTKSGAHQNGDDGIVVAAASTVSHCLADANGDDGIDAGDGSTVVHNTAHDNFDEGIVTTFASNVTQNTASGNGGDGIHVSSGSRVSDNTVFENTSDGIQTSVGATVMGNAVYPNTGWGLNLNHGSTYGHNAMYSNIAGAVRTDFGTAVNAGGNVCEGTATCP